MKTKEILEENSRGPSVDLKWSVKPNDPAMALVTFNAANIHMGEVSAADFKDPEQYAEMQAYLTNELKRIANRFTKQFGY